MISPLYNKRNGGLQNGGGRCWGMGPGSAVVTAHHHLVSPVAEAAGGGLLSVGVASVVLQLAIAGGHLGVQAVGEVM